MASSSVVVRRICCTVLDFNRSGLDANDEQGATKYPGKSPVPSSVLDRVNGRGVSGLLLTSNPSKVGVATSSWPTPGMSGLSHCSPTSEQSELMGASIGEMFGRPLIP